MWEWYFSSDFQIFVSIVLSGVINFKFLFLFFWVDFAKSAPRISEIPQQMLLFCPPQVMFKIYVSTRPSAYSWY